MRVGFIGLGRMGLPMCANLVRAGHEVAAGDARAELGPEARAAGADWRTVPAEAAAGAEVLVTMLPGPAEVCAALLEPGGALARLPEGATWIDMSTASPAVGRAIGARAVGRHVRCVDAPVGGGPAAARSGTLQAFVGGQTDVVEEYRPLLAALADPARILHVGAHGSGYTVKLLVNLLWFGQAVATAEALLVGRRAGLDLDVLRDALATSAAGTDFIRRDLDALLDGDYLRSFGLDRCHEELATITGIARELGVPFAVSDAVEDIHRRALERFGPVDGELLAVALLEQDAGTRLRRGVETAGGHGGNGVAD